MVGHGGSGAGSYLADPTSPIPSHCASIVATSTLRVKNLFISYHLMKGQVLLLCLVLAKNGGPQPCTSVKVINLLRMLYYTQKDGISIRTAND